MQFIQSLRHLTIDWVFVCCTSLGNLMIFRSKPKRKVILQNSPHEWHTNVHRTYARKMISSTEITLNATITDYCDYLLGAGATERHCEHLKLSKSNWSCPFNQSLQKEHDARTNKHPVSTIEWIKHRISSHLTQNVTKLVQHSVTITNAQWYWSSFLVVVVAIFMQWFANLLLLLLDMNTFFQWLFIQHFIWICHFILKQIFLFCWNFLFRLSFAVHDEYHTCAIDL